MGKKPVYFLSDAFVVMTEEEHPGFLKFVAPGIQWLVVIAVIISVIAFFF